MVKDAICRPLARVCKVRQLGKKLLACSGDNDDGGMKVVDGKFQPTCIVVGDNSLQDTLQYW